MGTYQRKIRYISEDPIVGLDLIGNQIGVSVSKFRIAAHNYGAAAADWTATDIENRANVISVTNASGAVNAIFLPRAGAMKIVINACGYACTVKASGQSGVAVANATIAILIGNVAGTDFTTVTTTTATISGSTIDNSIIGGTTAAAGTFTTLKFATRTSATHDYAGAAADWTMTVAEASAQYLTTTNAATGAANAILPASTIGLYLLNNTSGQAVTLKVSGGTGISVANNKYALLFANGTNVVRANGADT